MDQKDHVLEGGGKSVGRAELGWGKDDEVVSTAGQVSRRRIQCQRSPKGPMVLRVESRKKMWCK